MKILITGGAGFIGSNLCMHFLEKNYYVVCLDNFSTGHKKNISRFIKNSNFKLIEGDIRDIKTCEEAIDGIDYVLHHAALGSVPRSINDPIGSNSTNISGFLNVLHVSVKKKVKRFIYAASSSTYGDSTKLPKVEEEIGAPLSPYAITKYVNELYANNFSKIYNIDVIGFRYFNVFGEFQDPEGPYAAVIPKFINSILLNKPPIINGDGDISRDFTYVKNVVHINDLAIHTKNKKALNKVYNVAFGERTSLTELFNYIKNEIDLIDSKFSKIDAIYGPERLGDVKHSLANIDKAKKLLDYKPIYDVAHGLKNTVKWFYDNKL